MKKNHTSESGLFNGRVIAALSLCLIGVSLSLLSFAATPSSGTLTDTSGPVTYTAGPFYAPNVFGNSIPGECDPDPSFPLVPCDIFKLTVTLPAGYEIAHPNTSLFVRVEWGTPAADFDLYFWDAASWSGGDSFPQGNPIARSIQQATNFEQVEIPAVGGTHQYVVQVSTTLPAGQSFNGRIFLAPATINPVVPPGNASGIPPRFDLYVPSDASGAPSSSLGIFAAEPTIFGNPQTGNVFLIAVYEVLRASFNDSTSPAKVTWAAKDQPTNISNHVTLDPILWGDPLPHGSPPKHRLFSLQLAGGQSLTDYSDDDGETWTPTLSGGIASGPDHQGLGGGPYPTSGAGSLIQHPLYPNALYYCSQHVAAAACARSDDGGQTYGPIVPMYEAGVTRCVGLHGHPKVAPDGTVYVPDKGCGLDTPVLGNGVVSAIVSTDAGLSWTVKKVQDSTGGLTSKGDPSIGIDKNGKVYLAYQNLADNHLRVTTTTNHGDTWTPSVDVGALAGINYAVFPAATAGDGGRAAVAFFGSTYNGPMTDFGSMAFPGVWYLYIATTYDGGNTWFVTNATPDNPVQGAFAGIGNGGDNRNHYDFIDCEIDGQGRVIVSTTIGCAASCPHNGGPNTFQTFGNIVRQSGGRRMLTAFDPVEPAVPQPPLINGYRTSQIVSLSWPEADGSGLSVTGYDIYRRIDSGPETKIVSATTERQFLDVTDPAKTYSYRVKALNSQGASNFSNTFAPTVGQNAPRPELSCGFPGQVYTDRTNEGGTFSNNDIASFSIAEPASMPGKLVFIINNAQPTPMNSESDFYVFFDPARGAKTLRLSLTDMQVTDYKNGQFVSTCGTAGTDDCRDWQPVGPLDPASGIQSDGAVWLVIDKATYDIRNGDVLLGVFIREDTVGNPSRILASDFAGGRQDYTVVGNNFCTTPLSVVSRKTHGTAGTFDIPLPLTGTRGVECRSGDVSLVFTFPAAVTSCGSATQGTVTSGPASNQCTVTLTGLTNKQYYQVGLNGVVASGATANVPGPQWGLLFGDANQNGIVTNADVSLVKAQVAAGGTVGSSNFKTDINANGAITNADVSLTKAQVAAGAQLPTTP